MLPIVKRKALEIPHGLAAVAAAVCLVLAFATDFSDRDTAQAVNAATPSSLEFVAKHGPASKDEATSSDKVHGRGGDSATSAQTSALITWFGLLR